MPQTLEIDHTTRYGYGAPVVLAHHQAHLQPLHDAAQSLEAFDLQIDPAPECRTPSTDPWGNPVLRFSVEHAHTALVVRARSRVRVAPRFAALEPEASPAWDEVARRLRYTARAPFEPAVAFAQPSAYVPRLEALRALGQGLFPAGRPLAAAALALMRRVHADFRYVPRSTEIETPLAQVLQQRSGVCQDFAHLMAGVLRLHGLAARYVSGYLLTRAPQGGAAMVGADASHAWVQVWCPGTVGVPADGWLDLDPTNDLVPATSHVRVAVGRDYADVAPLRGVIRGGGRHTLQVAVHTQVLPDGEASGGGPGSGQSVTPGGAVAEGPGAAAPSSAAPGPLVARHGS